LLQKVGSFIQQTTSAVTVGGGMKDLSFLLVKILKLKLPFFHRSRMGGGLFNNFGPGNHTSSN
jgi:hypothetical protein